MTSVCDNSCLVLVLVFAVLDLTLSSSGENYVTLLFSEKSFKGVPLSL